MALSLEPGTRLGRFELVAHLNAYLATSQIVPVWRARGDDGKEYVLRLLHASRDENGNWGAGVEAYKSKEYAYKYLENVHNTVVEPLTTLDFGLVARLSHDLIEPDEDNAFLIISRPHYAERLIDHFPPEPGPRPHRELMEEHFRHVGYALDVLQKELPGIDLDLSPGDICIYDQIIITDAGLSGITSAADQDLKYPWASRVDPLYRVPLSASYPSLWQGWLATKSPPEAKVPRTNAQFAHAALYFYWRTGRQVFEDPGMSFSQDESLQPNVKFMNRIKWGSATMSAVQQYEENGLLTLSLLTDEKERAIVARALARDPAAQFETCTEFMRALRFHFGMIL